MLRYGWVGLAEEGVKEDAVQLSEEERWRGEMMMDSGGGECG